VQSIAEAVHTEAARTESSRRDHAAAAIGIWLVVLSTIALLPGAMDRWVLPKVAVAVVGCLLASFSRPTGRIPRWAALLIAIGALLLVVCALLGAEPFAQLLGRWPRYEGLVTLPAYFAALWTGARTVGPRAGPERYGTVSAAIATVSIAVGIVSILESAGLRPISSDLARPGSLLGNASDQGVVGVICFAVLIVAALGRAGRAGGGGTVLRRCLPAVGAAFGAATVVLSESRTDLAALIVVCALALVVVIAFFRGRPVLRLTLLALAATAAGVVVLAVALPTVRDRIFSGGSLLGAFGSDRGSLWEETLRLVGGHPLFGVGPSGFVDALPAYTTPAWFTTTGLGVTTDSPHSAILQAAVAGGIPLMILAVVLAVLVIVRGVRVIRRGTEPDARRELILGSLLALVGFGVALLATFTSPATTLLAAFLAGVVMADSPRAQSTAPIPRRWPRLTRTVLLSVWAAAIIVTTVAELPLEAATTDAANGDLSGSIAGFAAARTLRPWDSDITLIEAQSLTAAASNKVPGAIGEALHWSHEAHANLPKSVLGAKALAAAQQFDGQLAAASRTAAALNSLAPNDPETLARLGLLYAERGLYGKAQPVLEKTVRLSPRDTASWNALGYVYQKLGNIAGVARVTAALARLKGSN
jgi:O-antigen ligase